MPVIQRSEALLTTATSQNTIAGSAYEFARSRQVVSIGVVQSATGLFATIQSGSDIVAEEFEPFILTTPPVIPDHMYYNDVMEIGDRLVIRVRNPSGGTLTVRTLVQLSGIR